VNNENTKGFHRILRGKCCIYCTQVYFVLTNQFNSKRMLSIQIQSNANCANEALIIKKEKLGQDGLDLKVFKILHMF
jgi:hypothetical protein